MSAKSIIRDIKASVAQLDALLNGQDQDLKAGKRADIVMEKARLQTALLEQENTDKRDAATAKIADLTSQHEANACRINELETENTRLRSQPPDVRTVLDPNHEASLQENAALSAAVKQVISTMNDTERQVIVVRTCQNYANGNISLDVVRQIAAACHLGFNEQMQIWFEYGGKSEKALEDLISHHEMSGIEGGITRFVRALLRVRHGGLVSNLAVAKRRPDDIFV